MYFFKGIQHKFNLPYALYSAKNVVKIVNNLKGSSGEKNLYLSKDTSK